VETFSPNSRRVVLAASALLAPVIAAVTAWFENNRCCLTFRRAAALRCQEVPGVGIGGWATQKNIYRCRTAADWFVLRFEQTSNSHIF